MGASDPDPDLGAGSGSGSGSGLGTEDGERSTVGDLDWSCKRSQGSKQEPPRIFFAWKGLT